MNTSSCFVLKSAFAKVYFVSNDGIQKFAKELNGVMIRTLDENLSSLSANPTIRLLPINCLSVFDHFVGFAFKGLMFRMFHEHLNHF